MALCTRHFRIDRALKIHDQNTVKISYIKGFRALGRFLLSEPKSLLRKMQAEALIMFGEHDILYNPYKVAARAKKLLPHVTVYVIKGAGHGCIYDQPEESNRKILDFLRN
jgi:pimeloyl-ACP methyl ester carboxylesterase